MGPQRAVELAEVAVGNVGRGVVSFGLDGDELSAPPEAFEEAFRIAREGGLKSTPHAGELDGPESVRSALEVLEADRVLHGVRAVDDRDLLIRLAETTSFSTCAQRAM